MLEVKCEEYLTEVRSFAKECELEASLNSQLTYLNTYACSSKESTDLTKTKCILYKDWAPHSFVFTMMMKNKDGEYDYWFNGGLIFYNAGDTGVDKQFSVRLSNTRKSGWEVHT